MIQPTAANNGQELGFIRSAHDRMSIVGSGNIMPAFDRRLTDHRDKPR